MWQYDSANHYYPDDGLSHNTLSLHKDLTQRGAVTQSRPTWRIWAQPRSEEAAVCLAPRLMATACVVLQCSTPPPWWLSWPGWLWQHTSSDWWLWPQCFQAGASGHPAYLVRKIWADTSLQYLHMYVVSDNFIPNMSWLNMSDLLTTVMSLSEDYEEEGEGSK